MTKNPDLNFVPLGGRVVCRLNRQDKSHAYPSDNANGHIRSHKVTTYIIGRMKNANGDPIGH